MNRNWARVQGLILVSSIFCFLQVAPVHSQTRLARGKAIDWREETAIAGAYKGFVRLNGTVKRATLEIKDELDSVGNNFVLKIEGEMPISGLISANSYTKTKEVFAAMHFDLGAFTNLGFPRNPRGVSLSLTKRGERIRLESVEKDKPFLFDTCLPSPGCKTQPECEPC